MNSSHPIRYCFGLVLLLAASIAGCGGNDDVLAVIGDRTVTRTEFMDVVRGNERNYPFEPDSARKLAFEDIVRRELMVLEAIRRGMDQLPETQTKRSEVERSVLIRELYLAEAPNDLPVSDAEIRTFYDWRDTTANVLLIYTPTREAIDAAAKAIKGGASFEETANRYNVPGTLPPDGRLGWRLPGDLVDPLDGYLRTAELNELVGPVRAPAEGWFLLKVLERRPNDEQPSFEQQRPALEAMIRQRKQRTLGTRIYTKLREDYAVEPVEGGAQEVFTYYNERLRAAAQNRPAGEPSEEMLQTALATYTGEDGETRTYTFADMRDDISRNPNQRPDTSILPSIQQFVENRVVQLTAYFEARKRGMHEDPRIAREIDREVETFMVDGLYAEEVTAQVQVDEEDVRAAYERRKEQIQEPFEEISESTWRGLQNDAAGYESNEIFEAFSEHLKEKTEPFVVHEERVEQIPWPVPAEPS